MKEKFLALTNFRPSQNRTGKGAINNIIKEEYQLVSKLLVYSLMFHTLPQGHSAWFSGRGI